MNKKKLSLNDIDKIANSSNLAEVEKNENKTKKKEVMEFHSKILKYPKEWNILLKKARVDGKTALNEASYMVEAIRKQMVQDNIIDNI